MKCRFCLDDIVLQEGAWLHALGQHLPGGAIDGFIDAADEQREYGHDAAPFIKQQSEDDRWFIVIGLEPHVQGTGATMRLTAMTHRRPDSAGHPFGGPWGLLTEQEAIDIVRVWNEDERSTGTAMIVEVFRYDNDPYWTEEHS